MNGEPVHRTILALDVEDFTSTRRRDTDRLRLRRVLYELLELAFQRAAINRTCYECTDQGDSVLFLLNDVPKTRVLPWLILRLAAALDRHNRNAPEAARLRVRIVMHAGEVTYDGNGYAGRPLNLTYRLLDSELLHDHLASAPGSLALLVSDPIYRDIVAEGFGDLDAGAFQQVRIAGKNTSAEAWVYVPEGRRSRAAGRNGADSERSAWKTEAPRAVAIPRELPPDLLDFTGGEQELEELLLTLGPRGRAGPRVVAIHGVAGVGKSALAVRAAHRLAARFPDGQLYVDLHGATTGVRPLDPGEAVGRLLRTLGVDGRDIPVGVEEATARFRSLLAGRRILLLLDNADSVAQVRHLLPASPTCATLITSRQRLSTLDGAEHLRLDVLPPREAVHLLGRLAGADRLAREPDAAEEVARLCAYLPLALRIAGARLAARARWPVRAVAERLRDERGRLDELEYADLAVRSCFQVSYQSLKSSRDERDQEAARLFRLLGLHRGPEVGAWTAAALLDVPHAAAEAALERLVDAQLLEMPEFGRYRMHDLLLLFTRELAAEDECETERDAAVHRMLTCYLATAHRANRLLQPNALGGSRWRIEAGTPPLASRAEAFTWFEEERTNLLAAARQAASGPGGLPELTMRLDEVMFWFFEMRLYWREMEALSHLVLRVARQRGDRFGEAVALNHLGRAYLGQGSADRAIDCLELSRAIFVELDDPPWESAVLLGLGAARHERGELEEAIECLKRARSSRRGSSESGARRLEAVALNNLAIIYCSQGRFDDAVDYLEQSLKLQSDAQDRFGEAVTLSNLGEVHCHAGDARAAVEFYELSLPICRELGDRRREAEILRLLGNAREALGQQGRARACWHGAESIFEELGVPLTERELRRNAWR
jgi:tetratricopeptide (TPR) repeat protein